MRSYPNQSTSCSAWNTRFAAWLALLLMASALASCQRAPPEQRLREAVQALQESIERRDAASMQDLLAEDFVGPDGIDRGGARRLAQAMHLRHRHIAVALGPMEVELQSRHATVAFTAMLTGGSGGLLPESGRLYNVRTGWRLEGDEWRLTSAQTDAAAR